MLYQKTTTGSDVTIILKTNNKNNIRAHTKYCTQNTIHQQYSKNIQVITTGLLEKYL